MAKDSKEVGLEVKAYFAKKGIKMADVARILGTTPQTVTTQLSGRTFGRNTAKKWAETFGFSATFLMTGEGSLVPGEPVAAPATSVSGGVGGDGVFIPAETLELYNSMAESIRNLTELLKMKGGVSSFVDFGEKNTYPHKKP